MDIYFTSKNYDVAKSCLFEMYQLKIDPFKSRYIMLAFGIKNPFL